MCNVYFKKGRAKKDAFLYTLREYPVFQLKYSLLISLASFFLFNLTSIYLLKKVNKVV